MSGNFWQDLAKPFFVLAPMADVTDCAFRRIITKYGKPDVLWTEFVSADGLMSPGREVLLHDLKYSEQERPIVAQIFTSKPAKMEQASKLIAELGFDGLDINMGCPDRSIEKQGAGAALIKTPKLARELIRSAKQGIALAGKNIPVSVKTRLGYKNNELENWLPELLAEEPAVITIHARTREEMSKVPARWEEVKRAVEIRNNSGSTCLIIGNGDLKDLADAREKVSTTGADGAMLGRAIFGNPFLFSKNKFPGGIEGRELRLRVMLEHTKLFAELLGEIKSFAIMKKHYKAYVNGWDGAKELREKLMLTNSASEVEQIVSEYLKNGSS
ncbi:MAG: tRNA-dihydrouridine synthase [Patescibacteria group bacterium]